MVIVYYKPAFKSKEHNISVQEGVSRCSFPGMRSGIMSSLEAAWQSERRLPPWKVYAWDRSGFSTWKNGKAVAVHLFRVPAAVRIALARTKTKEMLPLRVALAKDILEDVHLSLVGDDTLPSEAIAEIGKSIYRNVREKAASHRNATSSILATLALDVHPIVRIAVANNESTDEETLRSLLKDDEGSVRKEALASLNFRKK